MKISRWMVLPLLLGISAFSVACDTGEPEVEEQVDVDEVDEMEGEPMEETEVEGTEDDE